MTVYFNIIKVFIHQKFFLIFLNTLGVPHRPKSGRDALGPAAGFAFGEVKGALSPSAAKRLRRKAWHAEGLPIGLLHKIEI